MAFKDISKLQKKYENYGQSSNVRILEQTGTRKSLVRDAGRKAKLPGKRVSKTGKVYWETRKNRTDAPFKDV